MSTKTDIIDLMDNASESALEKIFEYVKKIISEEKGEKIYTLEEIKNLAVPIAKKYGVKKLSLFGSYARGEANSNSDLDFLYDGGTGKIKSLFDYMDFVEDLEKEFKCHVDAVSEKISDKNFLEEIKNDEVILYAG